MKSKPIHPRSLAAIAGILLTVALMATSYGVSAIYESLHALHPRCPIIANYVLLLALPVLFALWVAWRARSHDRVAFITCAVPALLSFASGYAADIHVKMRDDNGHTLLNIVGYADPLDIFRQGQTFLLLLAWAMITAGLGLFLKRWILHEPWSVRGESKETAPPRYDY